MKTSGDASSQAEGSSEPLSYIGFAGVDWWYHNRAHSDLQLLTRLARDHKVLVVNSIGMRMPLPGKTSRPFYKIWRKLKSIARSLQRPDPDLPGFYVYSPLPWPFYGTVLSRRFGAWFVGTQVGLAARSIGIRDPVIFITPPVALPIVARMRKRALIYNRADKHSLFREANTALLEQLERQALGAADLILYANRTLMDEERALTADRAMHLDHGVDAAHFDYANVTVEPPDLASIPRPRIGFFGNLRSYMVDFSLFARLAKELPDAQIVLIGDPQDSTEELDGIGNIHLLGRKAYQDVPGYGASFDVALLPYQKNDWIRYCNPIKMKEYLALGLAVVSTDYPEAHAYEGRIGIAMDDGDFIRLVRAGIDHPLSAERRGELRRSVSGDTWDARAAQLANCVERIVDQRTVS